MAAFRTSTPRFCRQHCFGIPSTSNRLAMVSSATNDNDNAIEGCADTSSPLQASDNDRVPPPQPKKIHSVTVCMVPPPEYTYVWETISDFRLKMKDPGFYRWPPHANLMYPFLQLGSTKDDEARKVKIQEMVEKLQTAMRQCSPFKVTLDRFGTFGGKQRGVLWLNPASSLIDEADNTTQVAPLVSLQRRLEESFPMCKDQLEKGNGFTPHITLSHFENLDDALEGQRQLEIPKNPPLEFVLDRIYLLERVGDDGQFLRVAQIGLGQDDAASQIDEIFDPPSPFPDMPTEEAHWVHEERMKLKSRRNGRRGNRGGGNRTKQRLLSRGPRIPDTPEVIAAKRAERKAKREQPEVAGGESS